MDHLGHYFGPMWTVWAISVCYKFDISFFCIVRVFDKKLIILIIWAKCGLFGPLFGPNMFGYFGPTNLRPLDLLNKLKDVAQISTQKFSITLANKIKKN